MPKSIELLGVLDGCIPGKLSVPSIKLQNRHVLRGKGGKIRAWSAVASEPGDTGRGEPWRPLSARPLPTPGEPNTC